MRITRWKSLIKKIVGKDSEHYISEEYYKRYVMNSFEEGNCQNEKQYDASITRLYHTIEKGLSYLDYRPGFGRDNIEALILSMEKYSKSYDVNKFFYQTALSTLLEYIRKNKEYGHEDAALEKKVNALPGTPNEVGGVIKFTPMTREQLDHANFKSYSENRHSTRHFSKEPVDLELVKEAIKLAQHTPSACNRQGWKSYIISDKSVLTKILKNQNGNSGFGHEFDKLIIVTGDLRCFNRNRELHQVFIDGGMYSMRVIDSLFYEGIASVPLSASLNKEQEINVRKLIELEDAEVLIMFIGIGNYPEVCQTTRSERRIAEFEVI